MTPAFQALIIYHLTIGALIGLLLVFRLYRIFEIPLISAIGLILLYSVVYPYAVYRIIDNLDDEWFEESFE